MLKELSLTNLKDIDLGKGAKAFEAELTSAVRDIEDRPATNKARIVQLTVTLKPVTSVGENGAVELDEIDVEFGFHTKLPKRHTKTYRMKPTANGQLLFNDLSAGAPNQHTLDELGDQGQDESNASDESQPHGVAGRVGVSAAG